MKFERRTTPQSQAEVKIRAFGSGKKGIRGYAAVFYDGTPATEFELFPGLKERIAPGAFDDVMTADVRGLFNHNPDLVLGRTKSGTLALRQDEKGLRYDITPPKSRADIVEALERGDLDGSSFTFFVAPDGVRYEDGGDFEIRVITKVRRLLDVGPVTFPAYDGTAAYMDGTDVDAAPPEEHGETESGAAARARAQADNLRVRMALVTRGIGRK